MDVDLVIGSALRTICVRAGHLPSARQICADQASRPTALGKTSVGRSLIAEPTSRVAGANTNPTLQQLKAILAPKLAAHGDTKVLGNKFARRPGVTNNAV